MISRFDGWLRQSQKGSEPHIILLLQSLSACQIHHRSFDSSSIRISSLASCSTGPRGAILDKAEKDLLTPASNCDYTKVHVSDLMICSNGHLRLCW